PSCSTAGPFAFATSTAESLPVRAIVPSPPAHIGIGGRPTPFPTSLPHTNGDSTILRDTRGDGKCSNRIPFDELSRRAEIPRNKGVADGVGFEPTVSLHPRRFSRPVP